MQQAVDAEKKAVRRLIQPVLGQRIANAFRGATDPPVGKPPKLLPRGVTFSKATYKDRKGGRVDIVTAFREGYAYNGKVYVPSKAIGRVPPQQYGGKTFTVWAKAGRGRPSSVRVLGWVIDKDKKVVVYTILSGRKQKARLAGIGRV